MPNTYSQLHVQIVFAVKERQSLIKESHRIAVEKYICGIVNNYSCKPLAIYCNPDHIHLLIGLHPTIAIANIVRQIKASSSKYIKEILDNPYFCWQDGYAAFSYSQGQINRVIQYILNQQKHHAKQNFKNELMAIYTKSGIDYDEKYLFRWID